MFPGLMGENHNETLREMLYGMLLYGVVGQLIAVLFFMGRPIYVSAGWWLGILLAMACGYHMWWVLDRVLGAGEQDAVRKIASSSSLRYLVIVLVLAVVMVTDVCNPLAAVLGLFALKAGAYLQPFVHWFLHRKDKNTEVCDVGIQQEEASEVKEVSV